MLFCLEGVFGGFGVFWGEFHFIREFLMGAMMVWPSFEMMKFLRLGVHSGRIEWDSRSFFRSFRLVESPPKSGKGRSWGEGEPVVRAARDKFSLKLRGLERFLGRTFYSV